MDLKFNYQVPIQERGLINGDFIIEGTAINAITTSNNTKFLTEELSKSAETLQDVPLLVDHRNEVGAIKGRVIEGIFNAAEEKVDFKAKVIDDDVKKMIRDGRLNSVSVGAMAEDIEEAEDGSFIPRGIQFKELSLVAVPADNGATFDIALKEAYNTKLNSKNCKEVKQEMSKEEVKKEEAPKEEPKAEPAKEEPKEEPKKEASENTESETAESLKIILKEMKSLKSEVSELKKVKEADADEKPAEKPKEEPKETPKEEPKKEAPAEEAKDESTGEEEVSEKFKIIQGSKSFSVVRAKY